MQAQVTQLTQAVIAQENATIESILFFTQCNRLHCVRWVRLNGNHALAISRFTLLLHVFQSCASCQNSPNLSITSLTPSHHDFPLSNTIYLHHGSMFDPISITFMFHMSKPLQSNILKVLHLSTYTGWLCSSVVRMSVSDGELSLASARPVADVWPLMWV